MHKLHTAVLSPQVLSYGTPLLSSTGEELSQLENDPDYQRMTPQERLAFHRQQLKQRLGLVAQGKVFSTGIESLLEDSDLAVTWEGRKETVQQKRVGTDVLVCVYIYL